MPKLTYWVAACRSDAPCYSIIGKTRKSVKAQLDSADDPDDFEKPVKRVIHYTDAFDLFEQVTCEGGNRNEAGRGPD